MRELFPVGPAHELPDLDAAYAPPRRDWLRANFIASVDGAISVQGRSRGLQVPGDLRVFGVLRGLADAVLVGAGTARTEGYHWARPSAERQSRRRAAGLTLAPPIVVVSGSGDPGLPREFYDRAAVRPLVISPARAARPLAGAEVIACGELTVDLEAIRPALADRGIRHVVCEGGPTLLAGLAAAGQLDELCLTVSPLLAGPGPGRLLAGPGWTAGRALTLTHLLEEDGALFARYGVGRSSSSAAASSTAGSAPTPAGSA